ncbi:alpha/beta hydrolase [Planococcus chinensis]|uniref:Alpha/beta hydrolase n=1 Tax=Planococcus chinensis TaxID=272917 RepID=A0ABW4QHY3_9BACL
MSLPLVFEMRRPSEIDSSRKYPALFVLHGMGSNEKDMLGLVEGLEEHFFIFSIRGQLEQRPGFAFFTIERFGKPHQDVFGEAREKLQDFIDWATNEYPLDSSGIYLMGFSQGAILSMSAALAHSESIKGVVALSGYIPDFVKEDFRGKPMANTALFISHGQQDQVLPYSWSKESKYYFESAGADVTFKSYPSPHTVSLENYQDFTNWLLAQLHEPNKKTLGGN